MSFEELSKNLNLTPEAVQAIPEELRNEKSLEPMKDLTGLVKSYIESQKLIGGSIRIPKDDAKPEEIDAFYSKLGRPAKPDDYQYTLSYPEYINWENEPLPSFKEMAHKAGLTGKQVQAALDWYAQRQAEGYQTRKKAFDESVNTLKEEWKGSFDRNLALAKRVRSLYGGEEAQKFFANDPSGNDVVLIRMLAKIGADLEEGDFLGGPGSNDGLTPEEAKAKISDIMGNKDDLYHAKFAGQRGHDERVKEVETLYQIAYGKI